MDDEQLRAGTGSRAHPPGVHPAAANRRFDLYRLSPESGLILDWKKIEAEDEEAALRQADSRGGEPPMELWHEGVLVKRWDRPATAGK